MRKGWRTSSSSPPVYAAPRGVPVDRDAGCGNRDDDDTAPAHSGPAVPVGHLGEHLVIGLELGVVVPISGAIVSNNGLLNRSAAVAGAGIVLLPTFYIGDELRSGALVAVLTEFKPTELAIYAVYPERRNLTPKVRAFVDFLAATFAEPPWGR